MRIAGGTIRATTCRIKCVDGGSAGTTSVVAFYAGGIIDLGR